MTFINRIENLVAEGYVIAAIIMRKRPGGWLLRARYHDRQGKTDSITCYYVDQEVLRQDQARAMEFVTEEI